MPPMPPMQVREETWEVCWDWERNGYCPRAGNCRWAPCNGQGMGMPSPWVAGDGVYPSYDDYCTPCPEGGWPEGDPEGGWTAAEGEVPEGDWPAAEGEAQWEEEFVAEEVAAEGEAQPEGEEPAEPEDSGVAAQDPDADAAEED